MISIWVTQTTVASLQSLSPSTSPLNRHISPALPPALPAFEPALEVENRRVWRHTSGQQHRSGQVFQMATGALDYHSVIRS